MSEKEENRKAKLEIMEAYFTRMARRAGFLVELDKDGHTEEALLLCCCYIESMGNYLYGREKGNRKNFVRILKEYGQQEVLWHICPKLLRMKLAKDNCKRIQEIGKTLVAVLTRAEGTLYTEDDILALVKPVINAVEFKELKENLWRSNLAAISYEILRNPLVHEMSGSTGITFGEATFRGNLVGTLNFSHFYPALQRILVAMKDLSLDSGKWFGHEVADS